MSQPETSQEQNEQQTPTPEMGLSARLMNVYAAPGEVFESIRGKPFRASNLVVPALLLMIVSWLCSWLVLSQPAIEQQMAEMSTQHIDKSVEAGKMSEQQAEQARAAAEKIGPIAQKVSVAIAPVFSGFALPFIVGLVLWLLGNKVLKGNFDYMKGVEIAALAGMIGILDVIVRSLLCVMSGNLFATVGPAFFIKTYNPQNPMHGVLSALSVMTFWTLWARSVGLAKLSGAKTSRSFAWVFAVWFAVTAIMMAVGYSIQALTNR